MILFDIFLLRMDKSWITKDRTSNDFAKGVNEFLKLSWRMSMIVIPYGVLA